MDGRADREHVLIRATLSTTSVLDESSDVVRLVAAPWASVLIATSIPYRFMQVLFLEQILEVGASATHYGRVLGTTANLTILAFVVSLVGRAVYARACRMAAVSGTTPGRQAWRVPFVSLMSYTYVAAIAELLFFLSVTTIVGPIVSVILAGLAIGTIELNERAGIAAPVKLIARYGRDARIVLALALIFFVALIIAFAMLWASFAAGLWMSSAFAGVDITRWTLLLGIWNRRFIFLLIAGAVIAIEPFWIAANVMLVRKAGAEESGEELRLWFRELQSEDER